jgi:hypothetical protein
MYGFGKKARWWSVPRQRAPRENFVTGNQDGAKDRPYQEHQQNRRKHLTKPSSREALPRESIAAGYPISKCLVQKPKVVA